jgi:outer membrane protein assembly factor BamD
MNRQFRRILQLTLIAAALVIFPTRSPAPLVYRPGEGWTYEMPGGKGDWHRERARDQLAAAQEAFDHGKFRLALKSATRVVTIWPLSDYAPPALYLEGRCYEARKMDEKAFKAYEACLEKYPKQVNANEIQRRQFDIAVRFLHGQWFKLWGYIPFFPSMDRTADMFDKIVRYGPYGEFGAEAQMNIGAAREKEKDYPLAVEAYERAADRYSEQIKVASDALFKAAGASYKQAKTSEYDQSVAEQAVSSYKDFISLYPGDARATNAETIIGSLRAEQARGNFRIAQFYEKNKKWDGALIYYNEVLLRDAGSPLAAQARQRIESLKSRTQSAKAATPADASATK